MFKAIKANQSLIIAVLIALFLTAWIASGAYSSEPIDDKPMVRPPEAVSKHVRSRIIKQEKFSPKICVTATTKPSKSLEIKAETSGRLLKKMVYKGDKVKKGAVLFKIELDDRIERKLEAEAKLERYKLEYKVAQKLQKKNFSTETNLAAAKAELEAAKTRLVQIKLEIENTVITAPFSGIVNNTFTEEGDFINTGKSLAELIAIDPILFDAAITEQNISKLKIGTSGKAELLSGIKADGVISYISAMADSSTRTFNIEFESNNNDLTILAGITSELCLNSDNLSAHKISPSILSLDDTGRIGVKAINSDNRVEFIPVQIINSSSNITWVSGLPAEVEVITVGQGFVKKGDIVVATPELAPKKTDITKKSAE